MYSVEGANFTYPHLLLRVVKTYPAFAPFHLIPQGGGGFLFHFYFFRHAYYTQQQKRCKKTKSNVQTWNLEDNIKKGRVASFWAEDEAASADLSCCLRRHKKVCTLDSFSAAVGATGVVGDFFFLIFFLFGVRMPRQVNVEREEVRKSRKKGCCQPGQSRMYDSSHPTI